MGTLGINSGLKVIVEADDLESKDSDLIIYQTHDESWEWCKMALLSGKIEHESPACNERVVGDSPTP